MKCKFKFDPSKKVIAQIPRFGYSGYRFIDQPPEIPNSALREGMYIIRRNVTYGDFRGSWYVEHHYHPETNTWLEGTLVQDKICKKAIWNIFPKLSEKEYNEIGRQYKYLSKEWKDNYAAHKFALELRQLKRNVRKSFLN